MSLSVNSYIVGIIICFGLFFGVFMNGINEVSGTYDVSDANASELSSYNHLDALTNTIKTNATGIEGASVNTGVFDWFAGLWNKIKSPFVFIVQSYNNLNTVIELSTNKFQLMPIFSQALTTIVVLLIVFGLLAARYFMKAR